MIAVPAEPEYGDGLTVRDDFLTWVKTTWRNAYGQNEIEDVFNFLEKSFSDCTSYEFELQAFDVVGDMAFTADLEHSSVSVDGKPRSYTLRATQVYRREIGEWKVAHRHADTVSE